MVFRAILRALLAGASVIGLPIFQASADNVDSAQCEFVGREEARRDGKLSSGGTTLGYDSRIEKYKRIKQYRWCICNWDSSGRPFEYRWSKTDDNGKFVLDTIINGKNKCDFNVKSTDASHSYQNFSIEFREMGSQDYSREDVETIYYSKSENVGVLFLENANFQIGENDQLDPVFLTGDGYLNYDALASDQNLLTDFIEKFKEVELYSAASFSLPVPENISGNSDTYIRGVLSFSSFLRLVDGAFVTTNIVSINPRRDPEERGLWEQFAPKISSEIEFAISGPDAFLRERDEDIRLGLGAFREKPFSITHSLREQGAVGEVVASVREGRILLQTSEKVSIGSMSFDYFGVAGSN